MLKVTYHPRGTRVPDESAEKWMRKKIEAYSKLAPGEDLHITVANKMPIVALRVLTKEGVMDPEQVEVLYTKNGVLNASYLDKWGRYIGDAGPDWAWDGLLDRILD